MTSRQTAGAAATMFVALAFAGLAAQGKRVTASGGRVKLPAAGETQTMAFVSIDNPTMYEIYVVSATADAAGKVELRDGGQSGDARVKPIEFISVPAYESIDMKPDSVHLLLLGLKRPLKEGDTVALTLATDNAGSLEVPAVVRKE
jgi:periplasmic copper chaperone A